MFTVSKSGDYTLPSSGAAAALNLLLRAATVLPATVGNWILRRHRFYQIIDEATTVEEAQGVSMRKWEALNIQQDVRGRSLLDIGCAEGFFCLQAARNGARHVVGVESRFSPLLCATLMADRESLPIRYKIGTFPKVRLPHPFDFVLCLSVLHHVTSSKDIWKILSDSAFASDLRTLQSHLKALRQVTARDGRCIIEMP